MKKKSNKALIRFLVSALIIYIFWYVIYELWLHPWAKLDLLVINNLIFLSSAFLSFTGYDLIDFPYNESIRAMGIDGTHGLWIGDPCNGLTIFALFAGFIIAYPGKKLTWKLIYIPMGLISIHLFNVLRIIGLSLITYYAPEFLEFNHTYTFTIIIYSYVFLLWYFWASSTRFRKEEVKDSRGIG